MCSKVTNSMSPLMSPEMAIPFLLVFLSLSSYVTSQLFFPGFHDASDNLTLTGIAQIQNHGVLKLTNDTSRLLGHAFYTSPIRFKNSSDGPVSSFSTSFVFAIVPQYSELGGHGLAFAVSPTKELMALPSQYLGLLNSTDVGNSSNHLFAVEFDTVRDFEFGDINDNHVGIDINSLVSNVSEAAGYYVDESTKNDLNLKSGKPIQAWIDYDSGSNILDLTLSPNSNKPKRPLLSFHIDLSLIFDEYMYVGFSASTGLLASSHYVLGWSFGIDGVGQGRPLQISALPSLPGEKQDHRILALGLSLSLIVIATLGVIVAICIVRKIRNADKIEKWELEIGPQRFSYSELKKATSGFKEKELLGHGGFGQVYKGTLPESKAQVAVKRISHDSTQGLKEFVSEIASIGRLRHRNLVQLLGWCRRRGDFLLVYEFMANGSLDNYLFEEPKVTLNWEQRFHVIKGVAAGLLYLHEGYEQVVIHRDVKASNVLLDSELNGRLGDFGLARLYDHGAHPSTTRVVGTMGYLAPEVPRTGKATMSSDVFAFGAFLLEVACGRRPVEPKAGPEELVLVDVVWERYKEGKVLEVVDPKLNGVYNGDEVLVVIKLGLMCSNNKQSARPSMRHVVRFLDGEVPLPEELMPPNYDVSADSLKVDGEWFDDYMNSFMSSSYEDRVNVSFASLSTSSLPTPQARLHSF